MTKVRVKSQKNETKLVSLKVIEQKYWRSVVNGREKIVTGPWSSNVVSYNKRKYGPGEEFEALESHAQDLLDAGTVQLASEKNVIFMPPSLEHKIHLHNGIVLADEKQGMTPNRTVGEPVSSEWVDEGYEE